METVLLFVQSIFLLFSSVYICKESIEHVMLLGHDHGEDMTEVVLPNVLLATAFASALFSSIALGNHTKLSEG
jgi:divalent metal cation (Fe/Co/Zn/Cd) transporter